MCVNICESFDGVFEVTAGVAEGGRFDEMRGFVVNESSEVEVIIAVVVIV